MANMNMIIHDMEGQIEIGDTFKNPKFRAEKKRQAPYFRSVSSPIPCGTRTGTLRPTTTMTNSIASPPGPVSPENLPPTGVGSSTCHASLNATEGRAAVVLDTGAASRGSGNAGANKEKTVRQWFVEQDLIESVLYLPENLFYNTTAPGIVLFLNKAKPEARQRQRSFSLMPVGSSRRATPRTSFRPRASPASPTPSSRWQEEEKLSCIVDHVELKKNDYNISPSRYIHTSDAETYRPLAEIVEELEYYRG